jgi:hypothetical protein
VEVADRPLSPLWASASSPLHAEATSVPATRSATAARARIEPVEPIEPFEPITAVTALSAVTEPS